jgi:hypothetical protein
MDTPVKPAYDRLRAALPLDVTRRQLSKFTTVDAPHPCLNVRDQAIQAFDGTRIYHVRLH